MSNSVTAPAWLAAANWFGVAGEGQRRDRRLLVLEDAELLGALQVPQDDGAALVAGERAAVVDGERGRRALVELDGAHQRAGSGVPHPQRAVGAGRDDPAALVVGGEPRCTAPLWPLMRGWSARGLRPGSRRRLAPRASICGSLSW